MTVETNPPAGLQPGLALIVGGYVVAVLAATVISAAALTALLAEPDLFFPLLGVGIVYISISAIPGFIATVLIARGLGWLHWPYFIVAGGLDGFLSLFLVGMFNGDGSMVTEGNLILTVVAGGLAGGFVYWLVTYYRRSAV